MTFFETVKAVILAINICVWSYYAGYKIWNWISRRKDLRERMKSQRYRPQPGDEDL